MRQAEDRPGGRGLILFGQGNQSAVNVDQIYQGIDELLAAADHSYDLQPDAVDILAYTALQSQGLETDVLVIMNEELMDARRKAFKKAVRIVAASSLHKSTR